MARKIEFDRRKARSSALELFWSQGYSATSMAQLLAVMGIGQGSFYAAFGSKRELFAECLETFFLRTRKALERSMEKYDSTAAVAAFFRATVLDVPATDRKRGCMMVNTVLELSDVDRELSDLAAGYLDDIQSLFERCFTSSPSAVNEVERQSPAELASAFMVANFGLRVACRTGLSRAQLASTVDGTLAAMGAAANLSTSLE